MVLGELAMRSYVIAITDFEPSLDAAKRCIQSADNFDIAVEVFDAITPSKNPLELLKKYQINESDFETVHSRKINGICCFLSHYSLWKKAYEENESILIFEHDAIMISEFDMATSFNMLLSIGKPSYGSYNTPPTHGVNKLTSKKYLPGAHAYIVKPEAAEILIEQTKVKAKFADTFINTDTFPWIEEYYPWPVICDDSFTTVQAERGCKAKHNYGKEFRIVY
jgi:GR25 family glycosyltransferase involved in LPS biosynthesis